VPDRIGDVFSPVDLRAFDGSKQKSRPHGPAVGGEAADIDS